MVRLAAFSEPSDSRSKVTLVRWTRIVYFSSRPVVQQECMSTVVITCLLYLLFGDEKKLGATISLVTIRSSLRLPHVADDLTRITQDN